MTREQVHPAYTTLSEFFDVEFIAYGGASVSNNSTIAWMTNSHLQTHGNAEDGYTFDCQHGPRFDFGQNAQDF